jgi:hypothetical protein
MKGKKEGKMYKGSYTVGQDANGKKINVLISKMKKNLIFFNVFSSEKYF